MSLFDTIIHKSFRWNGAKKLPTTKQFEVFLKNIYTGFFLRQDYARYSWTILTHEFLTEVAETFKGKKIIEVASGTGQFSRWMKKYGCNVIATSDDYSWADGYNMDIPTTITKENALQTIKNNPDADIIVLSWPCYESTIATEVWQALKTGQKLLYIGEGQGGCTADDSFFEHIDKAECVKIFRSHINWKSVHDFAALYEK